MTGSGRTRRRHGRPARGRAPAGDPFAVLGLARDADLTDDEVRAAWRRIAAATHPDRDDGGDPEQFAAAAAAYTELRTSYGRGEARAGQAEDGGLTRAAILVACGPAARLAGRAAAAAGAAAAAVLMSGPGPAGPALVTGAGTWLILTGRRDLRRWRRAGTGQPTRPTTSRRRVRRAARPARAPAPPARR